MIRKRQWQPLNRIAGRFTLSCFFFSVCAAPGGCSVRFEWQGSTTNFRSMDKDYDDRVSRLEWEFNDPRTNVYSAVSDFERMDCDSDGGLTWHEYFRNRFRGDDCYDKPDSLQQLATALGISNSNLFRADVQPLLVTYIRAEGESREDSFMNELRAYPTDRSESPATALDTEQMEISCDEVRDSGIPEHLWPNPNFVGTPKIQNCDLINSSMDKYVGLVVASIESTSTTGTVTTLHAKAVNLAPNTTDQLFVLHSPQTQVGSVRLERIRILRPSN